jgi:nucleotide-binding universal stress UspA family protein
MAAPSPARRVLVAVGPSAADAVRTLRWAAAHVARPSDRVSLVHVRVPELLAAAATPVVEIALPAHQLPSHVFGTVRKDAPPEEAGPAAAAAVMDALKALQAAAGAVDAVELRSTLRVSNAILSYIRFLPAEEKADALVMGSHGARYIGAALWKVPHASLDIAAGALLPAC